MSVESAKRDYQASLKVAHAALRRQNETSIAANEASKNYAEARDTATKKRAALIAAIDAEAEVPAHVVPNLAQ